jgi:UDP-3-O-[3-hydroxymyristoyl] glucosamine N-acyltransferase
MSSPPFIHERALVETDSVGAGTRIWAFAHVLAGAVIGADCNVCDHTFIEGDVVVGDRVTLKSGVYLWDGLRIEDDVFIGPQATFTNDARPRSRQPFALLHTTVRRGASIGAGGGDPARTDDRRTGDGRGQGGRHPRRGRRRRRRR